VDLDADSGGSAPAKPGKPARPTDNSPPPQAGQPTDAASQAKRLYESEKWWDAAQALYRVSTGETGDDEGNKQIAQFNLAKALYKLKFFQAAYSIFSEIADKPNHLKYNETLLWLAKLATDLPEPADKRRAGRQVQQQGAAGSLLAAQLSPRPLQVPQRAVPGGAGPLRQGQPQEQVLRPGAVLRRHLQRAAPPEQAGGPGLPAHPRRHRGG
jgi:hypothetical protein